MAAIKIQSLRDVTRAYLQMLGYPESLTDDDVSFFLQVANVQTETAEELICNADEILFDNALTIFNNLPFEKKQTVAYFKLLFSFLNGAETCTVKNLIQRKLPPKLTLEMQSLPIINFLFPHLAA